MINLHIFRTIYKILSHLQPKSHNLIRKIRKSVDFRLKQVDVDADDA